VDVLEKFLPKIVQMDGADVQTFRKKSDSSNDGE
jgi:hypothetical protein